MHNPYLELTEELNRGRLSPEQLAGMWAAAETSGHQVIDLLCCRWRPSS